VYEDVKEDSGTDVENGPSSQAPRIILIVHGLQNNQQADEVYETIDLLEVKLKKHYKFVGVVVISNPKLLRHVSDDDRAIMRYVCVLHVPDGDSIRYSGRSPTPPTFYEVRNKFYLRPLSLIIIVVIYAAPLFASRRWHSPHGGHSG
jgi:hypothetical protein